jgi:hypothetical protein
LRLAVGLSVFKGVAEARRRADAAGHQAAEIASRCAPAAVDSDGAVAAVTAAADDEVSSERRAGEALLASVKAEGVCCFCLGHSWQDPPFDDGATGIRERAQCRSRSGDLQARGGVVHVQVLQGMCSVWMTDRRTHEWAPRFSYTV